jgi:Thoeris protein ThsB, TIR-like domain
MGIYEPKNPFGGLFGTPPPPPMQKYSLGDLLNPYTTSPLSNAFGSLAPPTNTLASLLGVVTPPPATRSALPVTPLKRKAFFSFHFDDVMRVNVVRNAWKITHPDSAQLRSFYDSSLWESRKLQGDDALKKLVRTGVNYTSAVCVLTGTDTWSRRWVRYEIARAIIDDRGLLSVHLNSIRHHQTRTPHTRGYNPLDFMAIGKVQTTPFSETRYYLFAKIAVPDGFGNYRCEWHRYVDYTDPIKRPGWIADPAAGHVTPLSNNADEYDYVAEEGHKNIGAWIDLAAKRAGR